MFLYCNAMCNHVLIQVKIKIIDLFENLAKHRFPVLYGFSSGELSITPNEVHNKVT
jgi:hypothetical protein